MVYLVYLVWGKGEDQQRVTLLSAQAHDIYIVRVRVVLEYVYTTTLY